MILTFLTLRRSHHHHRHLDKRADAEASSTSVGSLPGSWLAACMADIPLDFITSLSQGSTLLSFH